MAETDIETHCCNDNIEEKDTVSKKCQLFFKNAIDRYEDRRNDLGCRQKMLSTKIAVMERSIPVLMALNMQKAEGVDGSVDAVEQVRELMKGLSPSSPDPAEELVADLTVCVEDLNRETAELHVGTTFTFQDKIINADIQLEENCMELESLEQANRELEDQILQLENNLSRKLSLGTISSDDRICLAKIRQLGETEAHLKHSIRELEEKETLLRCQLEKILRPKSTKQKRLCDVLKSDSKHHIYRSKNRKKKERQKIEKCKPQDASSKKICDNNGCNALKFLKDNSMAQKCCDKQISPIHTKLDACKNVIHSCSCRQDNVNTFGFNQLCNCGKFLLQESRSKVDNVPEERWCSFL